MSLQQPMLQLEQVSLALDRKPIVRGLSFQVEKGELVCLLGPSGCGKTTTLRLVAGLQRPDSGTVTIAGCLASDGRFTLPPHQREIGFLFQDFALFPHLTVAENVAYGLSRLSRAEAKARTAEMLEQIRMSDHADKYPHMLSGGEQQRVALARARAPRPPILLLDEPFSGLDTSLRSRLREETLHVLKDERVTAVMVTHDPEEAMMVADRICLMRGGEIVQCGTPKDLYHRPVDAFTAEFFGEVNHFEGTVDGGQITTNIGAFANSGFRPGSKVDVLVRPEDLRLSASGRLSPETEETRVCGVQYTGRSSLVRIGVGKSAAPHTHIQARYPGQATFELGDKLDVSIDPEQAMVFPKTGNATAD